MHAATEAEGFVHAVFRALETVAPSGQVGVNIRYSEGEGALAYLSTGVRAEAESLLGFFQDHPAFDILTANPGIKSLQTKGVLAEGPTLFETEYYQKFMAPMGWRHSSTLLFWEEPVLEQLDMVFALLRREDEGDFTESENRQLLKLHAPIDRARRRIRRLEAERATHQSLETFVHDLPIAIATVSWKLVPTYHNRQARELAARWISGGVAAAMQNTKESFRLPAIVLGTLNALKKEGKPLMIRDPGGLKKLRRDIIHPQDGTLRAQVTIMPPKAWALANPTFLLQFLCFDSPTGQASAGVKHLEKLAVLTSGERAITLLVREGHGNQEIAQKLSKSLPAIKTAMHSIFGKLNIRSRGQLIALLR